MPGLTRLFRCAHRNALMKRAFNDIANHDAILEMLLLVSAVAIGRKKAIQCVIDAKSLAFVIKPDHVFFFKAF